MIRVTIELVPWGKEHLKQTIAEAVIANTGEGDHETGHYDAILRERVTQGNQPPFYNPDGVIEQATSHVSEFPRLKEGAWELLFYVLKNRSKFIKTGHPNVHLSAFDFHV